MLRPAISAFLALTVLTGVACVAVVTAVQAEFPHRASGTLGEPRVNVLLLDLALEGPE